MNPIDNDNLNRRNDRILCLLSELNSTLDLYYEKVVEKDGFKAEPQIKCLKELN